MKDEIRLPDQQECREKFSRTFRNLSQDELNLLFSDEFVQFYKKGSIVYSEGARMKGCYFVYNGIIKIFQTGYEGKEQIIKFEKEGDFFGFRSVILKEKACTSVKVLSDAILYFILYGFALLLLFLLIPQTFCCRLPVFRIRFAFITQMVYGFCIRTHANRL